MLNKKYCIFGCGGFGREVLTYLMDYLHSKSITNIEENIYFMVHDQYYEEEEVLGIKVLRSSDFNPLLYNVIIAVADPIERKKIVASFPEETIYATLIHPSALISKWVEIGVGSIITPGTILTCNIKIGEHAHLNLCTTVGHDTIIGDYFTTAPGVNISGKCKIGDCVYIGTNAAIRDRVKVCDNVVIGMGSNVVKHIEEEGVYVGNPAQKVN